MDHERFAHYVRKEKIVESAVTGEPVIALCGKVGPGRNPDRFPVCPICKEIYDGFRAPQDGRVAVVRRPGAGRTSRHGRPTHRLRPP